MVTDITVEDVGNISNTALSIGIVLARTPLPDLTIINVSFAGRMVETQESAGEDRNGILVVSDAREFASEFAVYVVGEVLVSDLRGKDVRSSSVQVEGASATVRTRGSP